jgi:hypothetical protein
VLSAPQLTFSESFFLIQSFFLISITDLLMGNSRLALDLYGLEEEQVVYCQAIFIDIYAMRSFLALVLLVITINPFLFCSVNYTLLSLVALMVHSGNE